MPLGVCLRRHLGGKKKKKKTLKKVLRIYELQQHCIYKLVARTTALPLGLRMFLCLSWRQPPQFSLTLYSKNTKKKKKKEGSGTIHGSCLRCSCVILKQPQQRLRASHIDEDGVTLGLMAGWLRRYESQDIPPPPPLPAQTVGEVLFYEHVIVLS